MSAPPIAFLSSIEEGARVLCDIPLWGNAPSFPWEKIGPHLEKLLQVTQIEISCKQTQWLPSDQLLSGLGRSPVVLDIELAPLQGKIQWAMGGEDLARLSSLFLAKTENHSLSDRRLQEGFYHYLCVKCAAALDELKPFAPLSPRIGDRTSPVLEDALCIDVSIRVKEHVLWGRLICPTPFVHAYRSHYAAQVPKILDSPLCSTLSVELRLEAGSTSLPLSEWNAVEVGDFVLLDRCTYDPTAHKGSVHLSLQKRPLFMARYKGGQLKLLDYANYMEEPAMTTLGDDEFPEDVSNTDEGESGESAVQEEISEGKTEELVAAQDISVTLHVELGTLKMSLASVLALRPGNVLELGSKPEDGVDVVLHGKRVARAELVKVGEAIGLKILQLHK